MTNIVLLRRCVLAALLLVPCLAVADNISVLTSVDVETYAWDSGVGQSGTDFYSHVSRPGAPLSASATTSETGLSAIASASAGMGVLHVFDSTSTSNGNWASASATAEYYLAQTFALGWNGYVNYTVVLDGTITSNATSLPHGTTSLGINWCGNGTTYYQLLGGVQTFSHTCNAATVGDHSETQLGADLVINSFISSGSETYDYSHTVKTYSDVYNPDGTLSEHIDFAALSEVPEPSSLCLFGTALAALLPALNRRRRIQHLR